MMQNLRPFFTLAIALPLVTLAGCKDKAPKGWQGYAEAEFVDLSTSQSGHIDALLVQRGDEVKQGDAIFAEESVYEKAACDAAKSQLRAAEAQLEDLMQGKRPPEIAVLQAQLAAAKEEAEQSQRTTKRNKMQLDAGGISHEEEEQSRSKESIEAARVHEIEKDIEVAKMPARADQIRAQKAMVEEDKALLREAEWKIAEKAVKAPQSGLVFDTLYRAGEWVAAGQPVVRLLPPENIKVRFFVPEAQIAALHLGDGVRLHRDGVNDVAAKISYISTQAEYTPPVIYSNETRAKLVFMVEARTEKSDARAMHPGQPVEVLR